MKVLAIIALSIAAIVALFFVAAQFAPKTIAIQSETVINQDVAQVFETVSHLDRFTKWSPYKEQDPQQKSWVEGTDGTIGAKFHWEGVAEQSVGYQELVALDRNRQLTFQCNITVPFEMKPRYEYQFEAVGNGKTRVKQQFTSTMGAPFNLVAQLMGVKNQLTAINARGLELLKLSCETTAVSVAH